MKNRILKLIICLSLAFCSLLPKNMIIDLKADTPDASNSVYLYTYNGSTYNQDKRSFPLTLGQVEYTTKSVIHNYIVMEIYPYEFYNGDYLKLNFALDILDDLGNRRAVHSAHFTIYNQNDYTGTLPYELEITESGKNQYSYEYRGRVENLDKPGNSIRIQIFLADTTVSTTGVKFLYFNCDHDSDGKTHGLLDSIITMITYIPTGIAEGLSSFFGAVVSAVNGIGSAITSALSSVGSAITSALDTVKTTLSSVINTMSTAITNTLNSVSSAITTALTDLGDFLISGIQSLFVPDDDFLGNFFTDFNELFSTQFGFLWYPVEFCTSFLNEFKNKSSKSASLKWAEIKDPVLGLPLIPEGEINFTSIRKDLDDSVSIVGTGLSWNTIFYYFTDAILYLGLIMLASRKVKEMLDK